MLGLALFLSVSGSLLRAQGAEPARPEVPSEVRIYSDALHVPHVFAGTDAGVFRGLGYSQVHDFPIATLANLWCATGRFAEVAGKLALPRDERMRQWGFDRRAHGLASDPARLDPLVRTWLAAYIDGVNAARRAWLAHPDWIDTLVGPEQALGFDPVPSWLQPLRVREDARARIQRLFEAELGLENVLAYGLTLAAGPDFGGGGYSTFTNVWMMRGSERDPGTRLLADVHQPLQEEGYRSYAVQLAGPSYDAIGNTVPGFPCIVLGANRELAFASMTLPKTPRKLAQAGLGFRIDDATPLAHSVWSAPLEPGAPARFRRGEELVPLVERDVTLRYWDLEAHALVDDPDGALRLRWVREADGEELPVLQPGPREVLELVPPATIRYEARTFFGQRCMWETWMRMGTVKRVGPDGLTPVLERECLTTGRGQIVLACDAAGGFEFLWSSRAPLLTAPALAKWNAERDATLFDGRDPEQRWLGIQPFAALPHGLERREPGDAPEAWIECNGSPQFLSSQLSDFSYDGPPTVWDGQPWMTRRQPRARELFANAAADGVLATDELERMALDVQDGWAPSARRWLWALADAPVPLPDALPSAAPEGEISPRARAFLRWVEDFRCEGPDGKPGKEEFLAHPLSQVMPFLVLLRDRYEDELVDTRAPAAALAQAFDPLLASIEPEAFRTDPALAPNRRALLAALEWVAELRERTLTGAPGGLENAEYLRGLGRRPSNRVALFPEAWSDPLYERQAEEWGSSAPPVTLRWGQLNVYALTPHRWAFDPKRDSPRQVEAWLASIFAPDAMELPLPFYRAQRAAVFPSGGTHESLFQVHREGFLSYAKALLPHGPGFLALAPIDFGSQVLFLAEMLPDARPRVHVLPALGATEITVDIPGHGARATDLFAPTARFARGEWSELVTDEEALRADESVRVLVLE